MKLENGEVLLSPSDLMRFMGCAHAITLDLARLRGEGPKPVEDSEEAELVQAHGHAHEAAYLARLEAEGRRIIEIDKDSLDPPTAAARTREALAEGPDVVFQAALFSGRWGGYADFLERVERSSALGPFSYEVVDTKLKRRPDPKHVLQLVVYSDLLDEVQGAMPEHAHLELGSGERATLRLQDYAAYARHARAQLEAFVADPPLTRPEPVAMCQFCCWREHCQAEWEETDSLVLVAGITTSQRRKLEAAGVTTMAALAEREARVPKLAPETLAKLRTQARLQTVRRRGGPPAFELKESLPGRGFDRLPPPDPGDVFFDMEGDPYHEGGLEYLFGFWFEEAGESVFRAVWAHDRDEERAALAEVMQFFAERLRRFPKAHIYHYAAYEVTALRRLVAQHGIGEAMLDQMLREERFVDLYAVVRGALFASEPGYSIKDLEAFYMEERSGEVKTAGGSVVAYERWRESPDPAILEEIRAYNEIDCRSTRLLRDWLIGTVRPKDMPWPDKGTPEANQEAKSDRVAEEEEVARRLHQRLEAAREQLADRLVQLLFDLSFYHAREKRPGWWGVFDRAAREPEELIDDLECLAGLVAEGAPERVRQSWERSYRFPEQETKLSANARPMVPTEDGPRSASLVELDRQERRARVRFSHKAFGGAPERADLLPPAPLDTDVIEAAIGRVVDDCCAGPGRFGATEDLLRKAPPRFGTPRAAPIIPGEDVVAETVEAIVDLDRGVLPIQGPPGTGKTYVSSRAILHLVRQGKRVAVASNSHKAIDNLLLAVVMRAFEADVDLEVVKRGADEPEGELAERITLARKNDDPELFDAPVVGGTAWLFSRRDFEQAFDYLFVDEAGQVSLANLVAMGTAARNIVLVGDPMQLPQVVQGTHPGCARLSALEYLLGGENTVPPERGIFLPRSRRMHPELCDFVSAQVYEGRLASEDGAARQALIGLEALPASGAHLVEVAHEGNSQSSPEEITAIEEAIGRLIGTTFRDRDGDERRLGLADILVVAPYNAQVNALQATLPKGARVGTVDKFQGQEAPVCLVSMTTSSAEELPRDVDFLFSLNRINVAVSRAQILSLLFASPRLLEVPCQTVEQMRLVNTLCALKDYGRALKARQAG